MTVMIIKRIAEIAFIKAHLFSAKGSPLLC